ncbi:MAG: amino acid ABC transporter ATP-binding protein [Streptococcaceae bacterium]|nr:amino acid ABC transporter ATP-binding protein [Streptococcaceae bacterium]
MSMVEFKQVNKYYGSFHALEEINLEIEEGQVVVIIGPSGSGKSTLLRTINALEIISSGCLLVNGYNLADKKTNMQKIRKNVGMVFQHFNLYPHKTVMENITLAPVKVLRETQSAANKVAEKYLKYVNMWDKKDSYPEMLSGGQKQRVAIARGLAMKPKMMLFDEPTSSLDPETIGDVLNVMRKLAKEGMSMIVVTHEMGFAKAMADRLIFMADGKVLEDTLDVQKFFVEPQNKRAKDFLSKVINH